MFGLNQFTNNATDDKLIYCPMFYSFLAYVKPQLITLSINHIKEKETLFSICANKICPFIKTLCEPFNNVLFVSAPNYIQSKVNEMIPHIQKLILEWEGPIISDKYKEKVNDPIKRMKMEPNEMFTSFTKFKNNSINWLHQSSFKVEGEFFVRSIESIVPYINTCCAQIINVTGIRNYFIDCVSLYFVIEFLSTTIKYRRTKHKPFLRNKTLRIWKRLHTPLKKLGVSIDEFDERFKVMEAQCKKDKKKGERIEFSKIYSESLLERCKELMHIKKNKLRDAVIAMNAPTIPMIPAPILPPLPSILPPILPSILPPTLSPILPSILPPVSGGVHSSIAMNAPTISIIPAPINSELQYSFGDNISIENDESKMDSNDGFSLSSFIPLTPNNTYNNYNNYGSQRGYGSFVHSSHPYNLNHNQYLDIPNISPNPNSSNDFMNSTFNDEFSSYYGNDNPNIIGPYLQEVELYTLPELSECINGQNAVNAVNASIQ